MFITEVNDMTAKAKKVTLYLGNGTLEGLVNISESDGWDLGGELFSCPRNKISELLSEDVIDNKVGVYLLLSNRRVYVGQAVDLKYRTKQHLLDKDWWERVIFLTSDRNGLNQSHITYLEARLIFRAMECGTSDVDNKTKGNKNTLSKFDTQLLDQYLAEAYFVLELIGVSVFKKDTQKHNYSPVLPPIVDSSQEEIELRAKSEVKSFLKENNVGLNSFFSYAKLQEKKGSFWLNPDIKLLKEDWMLVLNNQIEKIIYILAVPANTFNYSEKHDGKALKTRSDKPMYIDLNIHYKKLADVGSKQSFKEYIVKTIKY